MCTFNQNWTCTCWNLCISTPFLSSQPMRQNLPSSKWQTMKSSRPIHRQNGDLQSGCNTRSWSIYSSEALLFSCDEQLISSSWIKTSILISFIAILFIFIFTIQKPSALFLMYMFDKLWREMLSCCHRIIIFLGINTVNFCAKMFIFYFLFYLQPIGYQISNFI